MKRIEQYRVFEVSVKVEKKNAQIKAIFTNGDIKKEVKGFYNGNESYMIRFMPEVIGAWKYSIFIDEQLSEGEFECTPCCGMNHGMVKTEGFHFKYADGTKYLPFGTTCYAWTHQSEELMKQTIETLKMMPFNKIRMCVFPKSMPYNNNDPKRYPFLKDEQGKWDVNQPDVLFWNEFEEQIQKLDELSIEADLILFHPYDRWGFADFTREEALVYLEYCVRRLSAYKNIWWSFANEFDLLPKVTMDDWDAYAEKVIEEDVYGHLRSIHNCLIMFPKKDWMTHCSIQTKHIEQTIIFRKEYDLPVLIDECGYEGNIEFSWGNLSAFEMVNRFWCTVARGGYCTHGETFFRVDEVLWWAKGGTLYGESSSRIGFLKDLLSELKGVLEPVFRFGSFDPNSSDNHSEVQTDPFMKAFFSLSEEKRNDFIVNLSPMIIENDECSLQYIGRQCPLWVDVETPSEGEFKVEIIDVWEMTRKTQFESASGKIRVLLPGKEGMAVLMHR